MKQNNIKVYYLIIITLLILSISSCSSSKHRSEEANFDRIDSLRAELLIIEDTLLFNWNVMIHDDNERISDMSRLIDELKYANAFDTTLLNTLKSQVNEVKSFRYFMTKMTSDQIDEYDSISMSLSAKLLQLVDSFPELEKYPYMNELVESIIVRETNILYFRIHYDDAAKAHNRFVKENVEFINQIDAEYHHNVLPLFELPSE